MNTIRIATRGSALALAQANMIFAQCRKAFPRLDQSFPGRDEAFLEAHKFSVEITQQPLHRRHHVGRLDAVELRKVPVVEKRILRLERF